MELAAEAGGDVDLDDHLPERRLALLDRDGIDVAVISPAPTHELDSHQDLVDAFHEGIGEVAAASGGRFVPLALSACSRASRGPASGPARSSPARTPCWAN